MKRHLNNLQAAFRQVFAGSSYLALASVLSIFAVCREQRLAPADGEDLRYECLKRHFDDDAIIELTGLVAFQNLSSKFNASLGVPAQGFCRDAGAAAGRKKPK